MREDPSLDELLFHRQIPLETDRLIERRSNACLTFKHLNELAAVGAMRAQGAFVVDEIKLSRGELMV